MPIILKRPAVRSDLASIWNYIGEDSEARADIFVDLLQQKFAALANRPLMGRPRPELGTDIRSFPVGRYIVFYVPIKDGIDIIRVLHSARDIDQAFER